MLHYMYEHFIDKFEWFVRADDDVFIKTEKLEKFLRSIDSNKTQFIGELTGFLVSRCFLLISDAQLNFYLP